MGDVDSVIGKLPDDIVTRDQDIISAYVTDFRRLYQGRTKAVLRPRSVAEVQTIVRLCAKERVALVPQGGNTSYCTAATPDKSGEELVISLERMTRVLDLDHSNLSLTVEAGIILSEAQRYADEANLLLPLGLGSQQSCRIGGNLSTNAGGISVLRYGMARDIVLGLEVVLPDGSLFSELSPLRKNNSGYDVKQLFIGAEGTLGIITAASLKLMRKPRQRVTAFLAIRDICDLVAILDSAQAETGEAITSFEYISDNSLQLLLASRPDMRHPLGAAAEHYVLMEATTSSSVLALEDAATRILADLMEAGVVTDGVVAASGQQASDFWTLRESIPEAEVHHGGSVKHDIAVRTSRLANFVNEASAIVRTARPDARLSIYGHVGDGNVHFNVVPPQQSDTQRFKQVFESEISPRIYALAHEMEGTFSAEYGIGRVKLPLLELYGAPGKLRVMNALKEALDPCFLMNPGKVVLRSI